MTWIGWLACYLVVGALFSELAMWAQARAGGSTTGPGYVVLVLLWPLLIVAALGGACLRKGRRNG